MPSKLTAVLLSAACTLSCSRHTEQESRPSILFISIDTLSARHMSLYGYERETTPGLDRLALESVVFERCWANAPKTTPSYLSQFTGLLPESFRKPEPADGGASLWTFAPQHASLAEVLRESGYQTSAIVDNPNAGVLHGLERGFEHYDDSPAGLGLDQLDGGVELVLPLADQWLAQADQTQPYFLFLQVLDVHGPYYSGEKWNEPFPPSSLAGRSAPVAQAYGSILGAIPKYIAEPISEPGQEELELEPIADAYDRGVRAMDEAIAGFIEKLDSTGALDYTWIVISADHGESMCEHDSYFNHQLLHGEELHVPLLIRPPGGTQASRVQSDVQLVDLFPTLLDVAGLEPPHETHGRSLLPALNGEELEPLPTFAFGSFQGSRSVTLNGWKLVELNPSLASSGLLGFLSSPRAQAWIAENYPELAGKAFGTHELPVAALSGANLKALKEATARELSGPFYELYNLNSDPDELHDLSAKHPDRVQSLLALLDEQTSAARSRFIKYDATRAIDAETFYELEKLGYTEESE